MEKVRNTLKLTQIRTGKVTYLKYCQSFHRTSFRFFLYLRLFIVMGVTWSMEAISWVFPDNQFMFYASDFLNCLQGFIIFILFVWKPKVKNLIIRR